MGFDDVLNIFLPKHTISKKEIKKYLGRPQTKDSRNHLLQGVRLGNLREGFEQADTKFVGTNSEDDSDEGKKKWGMKIREEKALKTIEDEYNRTISDYASAYTSYLTEFATLNNSMKLCSADCIEKYKTTDSNYVAKRKACYAGCQLKGVQIQSCKNSYKGLSSDKSKKCHNLVADHCTDGSVNPGASSRKFVRSSSNVDSGNTKLVDGCCECGGGITGKPTGVINTETVKNCNEVNEKLGNNPDYKSACLQAGINVDGFDATANANFINLYDNVKNKNNAAMSQMKKLAKKINILTKARNRLKGTIASEEDTLDQNLKEFEEKYSLLQSYGDGGKDHTSMAQYDNITTKRSSEELKFYMWSVLAIVLIITVVANFKKKAA